MGIKSLPRTCWICGKAVKLENCKVDEYGLPVHEDCYVAKLTQNRHLSPAQYKVKNLDWYAFLKR